MTIGGWISMTTSLTVVIGLFCWCMFKLVTTENASYDAGSSQEPDKLADATSATKDITNDKEETKA